MLNIGLVGVGHLGKIHLKLLKESSRYNLVGFYDSDVEKARQIEKEFNCVFFENFEELLSKIEVLDIVTPTTYHYQYAKKAIENKIHFFIEKPITNDLAQANELIQQAKENNVKAQVGHVERYNPAFLNVREFIKNPMFIEIHRLAEFNPRGTDVSVVLDLMIHDIDILLSVVQSKVKNIYANGVCVVSQTSDIANVRVEFENGCVANLTTSRISMKTMRKGRFFQKDSYISVDFFQKKAEIISIQDAPEKTSDFDMIIENAQGEKKQIFFKYPEIPQSNAILNELETFADSIEKNAPIMVTLQQGTEALKLALDIMQLIENNQIKNI